VIWGGWPAQAVIVGTASAGGGGTTVTCDLGLPLDILGAQRSDQLLLREFELTLPFDSRTPIEFPAMMRAETPTAAEVLGGIVIARDSLLSTEFAMDLVRDWGMGAARLAYRRFSHSVIGGRVRRLFLAHGMTGTLAFETGAMLGRHQNAVTEVLATAREDQRVPIEALGVVAASITADSMLPIEGLTAQHADWGVLIEALGAVGMSFTSGSMLWIEGQTGQRADWQVLVEALGVVAALVTGDSRSPIEAVEVQRYKVGAAIEGETNLRVDPRVSIEALVALSEHISVLAELLAAGSTTIADAALTIELSGANLGVVYSLESGSDRIRLLITPGRVRLLRRT
jgi:hypothetical protein